MPEPIRCDADVIAGIVKEHIKATVMTVEADDGSETKCKVVILPKGLEIHTLKPIIDAHRERPERRKGTARLHTLASFIAHANRFKMSSSALFAMPNAEAPSLTSVIDYHDGGEDETGARFGTHRGVYSFPLSDEWQAWVASNGNHLSQADFAEWIEEHITDIADPGGAGASAKALAELLGASFASPSKLLELSRGLSVRVGSKVTNATNLATGEAQMPPVPRGARRRVVALRTLPARARVRSRLPRSVRGGAEADRLAALHRRAGMRTRDSERERHRLRNKYGPDPTRWNRAMQLLSRRQRRALQRRSLADLRARNKVQGAK